MRRLRRAARFRTALHCVVYSLWLATLASSGAAQSSAQPSPQSSPDNSRSSSPATAGTLFHAGVAAHRAGEHARAIELLKRSIEVEPSAVAFYLLGQVQLAAGVPTEAAAAFKRFLRHPEARRKPERVQRAEQALDSLRTTHAWVKLHPWLRPLALTVDGVTPPRSVVVLPAGSHRFEIVHDEGSAPWGRDLELAPGRYLLDVHPRAPQNAPTLRLRRSRKGARGRAASGTEDASGEERCDVLGSVCIGPWVTFGLPHLAGVGVQARRGYFALALDLQASPALGFGTVDVQTTQLSGSLRVYPLNYPFFAGVGLAYQYLRGHGIRRGEVATGRAEVTSLSVTAGFSGGEGWVVGADIALLFDLHEANVELTLPEDSTYFEEEKLDSALEARLIARVRRDLLAIRTVFPVPFQLNFIRVGYMF